MTTLLRQALQVVHRLKNAGLVEAFARWRHHTRDMMTMKAKVLILCSRAIVANADVLTMRR
jgi:hypothetical protein